MTEPTDAEIAACIEAAQVKCVHPDAETTIEIARAVLAKWGTPQQEAQEPCPTCIALARTVMLDHVSFDRKPDCYGIRQITDDEGVEEWEDIRTSPDVAREEANDMMATGRGEIYEVVPLWTTPQPTQAQAGAVPLTDEQLAEMMRETWGCASIAPRHAIGFARAIERAHGIGIKGGQHGAE